MINEEKLKKLEALCKNATPGPWLSFVEGRDHQSGSNFIRTAKNDIELSGATIADQDFIAECRHAVPTLVDEIRQNSANLGTSRDIEKVLRNLLMAMLSDGFNRSLNALKEAGAINMDKLSSGYTGVGSKYYDLVTQQMEFTLKSASPQIVKLFKEPVSLS